MLPSSRNECSHAQPSRRSQPNGHLPARCILPGTSLGTRSLPASVGFDCLVDHRTQEAISEIPQYPPCSWREDAIRSGRGVGPTRLQVEENGYIQQEVRRQPGFATTDPGVQHSDRRSTRRSRTRQRPADATKARSKTGATHCTPLTVAHTSRTQGSGNRIIGAVLASNVSIDQQSVTGQSEITHSRCTVQQAILNNASRSRARPFAQQSWVDMSAVAN